MAVDDQLQRLLKSFEEARHINDQGDEFWLGRELAQLLGYVRWDTFEGVIKKAALAAFNAGQSVENHFSEVRKMVSIGYGNDREIGDYALSRYGCYLVAQNAYPGKKEVAAAQTYFAIQTRKQEVSEIAIHELKRVEARNRLTETEKKLSGTLSKRGVDGRGIAEIRSTGDQALFGGFSTNQMKARYGIKAARPLADFLPTVTLKAKDLAAEMTSVNTVQHGYQGKARIKTEHERNNISVRRALTMRNIKPEDLPPEEDIKKVERRVKKGIEQPEASAKGEIAGERARSNSIDKGKSK
jgi:DNA-damage-inducible protein D